MMCRDKSHVIVFSKSKKIKSSFYLLNTLSDSRVSGAQRPHFNFAKVTYRWQLVEDLTGLGFEPHIFCFRVL